jgi:YD repeat-containing protein
MLFDYDAAGNLDRVIDPYGREIDFVFDLFPDGVHRLVRVIDFIGREVEYTYDDRGDLVEVRAPLENGTSIGNDFPAGRTERYEYSSGFAEPELNHNLLALYKPEEVANSGPPVLQWVYGTNPGDPLTFDKVLSETEGGTNASGVAAGGTTTFVYEELNTGVPPGNFDVPRGKATITERNGNQWEYFVNERQHHILTRKLTRGLRAGEPAFYETRAEFTPDGLLAREIRPEGNSTEFVYDSAGARGQQKNLVEKRRVAGPRGGGEDLVTTFTYEPLFNQLASITDPRGNATAFVPPLGVASADRYTTRWTFDYQEGSAPVAEADTFGVDITGIPRGLGDQNADARTDQVSGNRVRRADAPVLLEAGGSQDILWEFQLNDVGQRIATIDPEGNVSQYDYLPENDPDGDGVLTRTTGLPLTADPTGYRSQSIQDSTTSARRTSATPPVGLVANFGYDRVGNLTSTQNPRGVTETYEYNVYDEIVVTTAGADVADAIASGELVTPETAFAYKTHTRRDHNGRVTALEIENRDGNTAGVGAFIDREIEYDILDQPVRATVEVDATTVLETSYRYDPNELLVSTVYPEGNETRMTWDERNLLFEVTRGFGSPDASTTRRDYDDNENLETLVDAADNDGTPGPGSRRSTVSATGRSPPTTRNRIQSRSRRSATRPQTRPALRCCSPKRRSSTTSSIGSSEATNRSSSLDNSPRPARPTFGTTTPMGS